ncbi:MAG: glycosyl transferase group 1, partial [Dolichospermum sp.]
SSLCDHDQEHFSDLTNYLVSNIYKSGQPAVYYFDICAFHAEDIDIFQNVYDHVNQTILQVSNNLNKSENNSILTIQVTNLESLDSENINIFKPTILIDGVFFQLYQTGIARVWKSLLEQWVNSEFVHHILVLDRDNTAPKINGIRYRTIPRYDYNNTEA